MRKGIIKLLTIVLTAFFYSCTVAPLELEEAPSELSFRVSEISLSYFPSRVMFSIISGEQWEFTKYPEWVSIEDIDHIFTYEWVVTLYVDINGPSKRSGEIVVSTRSNSKSLPISQSGRQPDTKG